MERRRVRGAAESGPPRAGPCPAPPRARLAVEPRPPRPSRAIAGWLLAAAACGLGPACTGNGKTQRIVNGALSEEASIGESGYQAFGAGAYLEARGDFQGAERAYRVAIRRSPDSAALWARAGAQACHRSLSAAERDFARAEQLRPPHPRLALERSYCLQRHGRAAAALSAGRQAVADEPGSAAATLQLARLLARAGRQEEASRLLFAFLLRSPNRLVAVELARVSAHDRPELARWARALPSSHAQLPPELRSMDPGSQPSAPDSERPDGTTSLAELRARADPQDPDALIEALALALAREDDAEVRALLRETRAARRPARARARQLESLLRVHVGAAAADRWGAGYGLGSTADAPPRTPDPEQGSSRH